MSKQVRIYPTATDIEAASRRLKGLIHRTPVFESKVLNAQFGHELHFKAESMQKSGSFKFRGALNALLIQPRSVLLAGVATHSSGNHAGALAKAAGILGIKAYVVMPTSTTLTKRKAVEGYGAEIIYCEPTLAAREATLNEVLERTGAFFIHPYNNYDVICGQATAAYELLEDYNLDYVIAPVGGGGLLSGTASAVHFWGKGCKTIGAEPSRADDAYRSFTTGKLQPAIDNPGTLADGLQTSLCELTLGIIRQRVSGIVRVSEEQIITAMRLLFERLKIVVEPSAAVPLAALLQHNNIPDSSRIGIILSGGNTDLDRLPFL
ncbi:MAG: hypothetical protein RIS47_1416 [Bacteroidota bacterium]|jgi:threonine dehydratase